MNKIELSIVIVNYKTPLLTNRCVESIIASIGNRLEYEIIVVDNASKDNSKVQILKSFPNVVWVQNDLNEGFGRANNVGISKAKGEYLLLLNSDMFIPAHTIEKSLEFIKANPKIGALGCKLLNDDGSIQRSVYYDIVSFKSIINQNIVFVKLFGELSHSNKIKAMMGSFMMMPKSVYEKVGGFDIDFFMYFEEIDLCRRISKKGFELVWVEEVFAYHKHGASSSDHGWRARQIYLSQALMVYKNKGLFGYFLYHFLFIVNLITNFIVSFFIPSEYRKNILISQKAYLANFSLYLYLPFQYSRNIGAGKRLLISK